MFGSELCLASGFGCAPPLLAGVMGCVCVLACALSLYPATPRLGVRCGCVCLGSGFGCAPPLLAGVLGPVCVCVRTPLVPRHSWLVCWGVAVCAWAGVSAAPRHSWLGVGSCVCLCARSAPTPLLLAGVRGVGLCVWARVVAAPRLSWLGCVGVRDCVRAPLVPRHSWLGCAVWVCVFRLGFRLRPATPGWGVRVFVCLCAHPACTPPFLAGVCGVGVCAWAPISAAPRHCWLGCWGVRVRAPLVPHHPWLGCALWVRVPGVRVLLGPATPGPGVGACVSLCARSACTPPVLAGVCGVPVCAWARVLAAPRHSWPGVGVCVCLCAHPACTPPFLAGVCGVGVCAWARVSTAPRLPWLGCLGVCVFVCALRWYPATPGWDMWCEHVCLASGCGCAPPFLAGVLGCACLPARSPGTPPILAGVCAAGVCVRARILAAPHHSWLGCWGVPVRALLVPRHAWLGCAVWVHVPGLVFGLRPATPGLGGWGV